MLPFLPGNVARHLRDGRLSERQKFSYVLLLLLLATVVRVINGLAERNVLAILLYTVISLLGTRVAFATNARGDNRHFIERWLCLHVPLSVFVVYVPQFLLYAAYVALYWMYGSSIITLFRHLANALLLFNLLLIGVEFFLLNHFIRIAASGPGAPGEEQPFAPIAAP